jgi:hypothetical protein
MLLSPLISLTALIPPLMSLLAILVDEVQHQPLSGKDLQPKSNAVVTVPRSRFVSMPDIHQEAIRQRKRVLMPPDTKGFRHVDLMFFGISRNDVCEGS